MRLDAIEKRLLGSVLAGAALMAGGTLTSGTARACGGTFCDAVPAQPMPVDQTGENILFVTDGDTVEAHIQIQYTGDPERFAWVIPVTALPEFEVGSQRLFDNLLAATAPAYDLQVQFEDCPESAPPLFQCDSSDFARGGGGDGDGDGDGDRTNDPGGGGPDILDSGRFGSFEFVVLTGDSTEEVVTWLDDNGYQQDEDAPPILDQYLRENYLFVALKLQAGVGLDELHPIVLRYQGNQPCVPLRLTGIAASPDMGVRTFFLGSERVVPTNYRLVEPNPYLLNWFDGASNYNEVVTLAVDDPGADGHGFVTEFAGPSSVVPDNNLAGTQWSAAAFDGIEVTGVVDELRAQGLISCTRSECEFGHPLARPVLETYLPAPLGGSPQIGEFYNCLSCYEDLIDQDAWDGPAFAQAMRDMVFDPAQHASDLLGRHPYLTRLFTTLSPEEMTVDPMFGPDPNLGDVGNVKTAIRVVTCEGPDYIELPNGVSVAVPDGAWPNFTDMPAAALIQQDPEVSGLVEIADHRDDLEASIQAWNDAQGLQEPGCSCSVRPRLRWSLGMVLATGLWGLHLRRRRRRAGR